MSYELWRAFCLARGWLCFHIARWVRWHWLLAHAGDWIYADDWGRLDRRRKAYEGGRHEPRT